MPKRKNVRKKRTTRTVKDSGIFQYNSFVFFLFVVFVLLATLYVFYR